MAQVKTDVPGAKPVTVARIKVHGTALEGNLEGNATNSFLRIQVRLPY